MNIVIQSCSRDQAAAHRIVLQVRRGYMTHEELYELSKTVTTTDESEIIFTSPKPYGSWLLVGDVTLYHVKSVEKKVSKALCYMYTIFGVNDDIIAMLHDFRDMLVNPGNGQYELLEVLPWEQRNLKYCNR